MGSLLCQDRGTPPRESPHSGRKCLAGKEVGMRIRSVTKTPRRSPALIESLEGRALMDATYQYIGQTLAALPGDRLAADDSNRAPVVIGDINQDGIFDLAIPGTRTEMGVQGNQYSLGFVAIRSGADGSLLREIVAPEVPYYGQGSSPFGYSIALGSDMNSDGVRDLIISDFETGIENVGTGVVRVYSPVDGTQISAIATNVYPFYQTTAVLGAPGDLDADGFIDVVVTGAYFTSGSEPSLNTRAISLRTGTVLWEGNFGGSLASYNNTRVLRTIISVGDVNSDGTNDILIGGDDGLSSFTQEGYLGLISGRDGVIIREWRSGDVQVAIGASVAFLGDVNADGVGDFAMITSRRLTADETTLPVATLNVFSLTSPNLSTPIWSVELGSWSADPAARIGFANVGDFNADGVADIGVQINPTSRTSLVRIYSGDDGAALREFNTTSVRPDRSRTTGTVNFGTSIVSGDLEGDGFIELFIGTNLAESQLEGQPTVQPFLVTIPTIKFETFSVDRITPAGVVFGTVGGRAYVSLNGIITPIAGLNGLLDGDRIFDFNAVGTGIGSSNADGSNAFLLVGGRRLLISGFTQTDLSPTLGFNAAPAGTYSAPIAVGIAALADVALVRRVRDGAVDTTWMVRRNAANTGYELVYLFDGDPVGISANAQTIAGVDGGRTRIADRGTGQDFLPFVADGFTAHAVGDSVLAGFNQDRTAAIFASIENGTTVTSSTFRSSDTPIGPDFDIIDVSAIGNGQVLTYDSALPQAQRPQIWSRSDEGIWTANTLDANDLTGLTPGATEVFISPMALSPTGTIFASAVVGTSPATAARLVPNSVEGPFIFDSARPVANAPVGETGAAIAGFNAFGELIYARRDSETSAWAGNQLVLPAGVTVYGLTAWNNGVAVATDQGLIRFIRRADGTFDSLNLTQNISGASAITRSLRILNTIDSYIILTGINAENEVVIYGSNAPTPGPTTGWSYDNLSRSVLGTFNIADPNLQGDLVTYVMPWNGLNIAGVNEDGEPVTFWTSPGISGWRFSNLAEAQENPSVATGFTRLVVNVLPWGGINLTNADNTLRSVWWTPSLGGTWRFAAISDVVQAAPRPQLVSESVVAFATTWGGQNIAGVDSSGHLWVYWWSPESDRWAGASLQSAVPDLEDVQFSPRLAAYATSGSLPMGVTGIDIEGNAIHTYFKIGTGWLATNATAELQDV